MITYEFDPDCQILYLKFHERIVEEDLIKAFELYDDERFSAEHHVLYDTSGATIDFTVDAFARVEKLHGYKNRRGIGTRTAFVIDSELKRGIASFARSERGTWGTNWRFFNDVDRARAWLLASDPGAVDFEQTI